MEFPGELSTLYITKKKKKNWNTSLKIFGILTDGWFLVSSREHSVANGIPNVPLSVR